MPLFRTINPWPEANVYLWDISETLEQLLVLGTMTDQSKVRFDSMKSLVHRKGFLSVRALLQSAGLSDDDLYYDQYGKPFLHSGKYISITHSHTRSAIIVAPYNVGIDIELRRPKIMRIAHKFCSGISPELESMVPQPVEQYTYVWTAKESIYKMASIPGLSFLNGIALSDWQPASNSFIQAKGKIIQSKGPTFDYIGFELGDYICGMTKDTKLMDHE